MTQRRPVNYVLRPAMIDNAKPHATAYCLTDGGGLYVEILPSGSKVWRYKYHRLGKREKVTLRSLSVDRRQGSARPPRGIARATAERRKPSPGRTTQSGGTATLLREHGFGRDVVELLLAHGEKNATVAAYSHVELAADRKTALQ